MSKPYPDALIPSLWVDYVTDSALTRDDRIAALATYHRRVEHVERCAALDALIDAYPDAYDEIGIAAWRALARLPKPEDYR